MKLKIIGGELEVEIIQDDAFGITEAKRQLARLLIVKEKDDVSKPTKDGMGKLGKRPKIPI